MAQSNGTRRGLSNHRNSTRAANNSQGFTYQPEYDERQQ